jgi:hypothetical protein
MWRALNFPKDKTRKYSQTRLKVGLKMPVVDLEKQFLSGWLGAVRYFFSFAEFAMVNYCSGSGLLCSCWKTYIMIIFPVCLLLVTATYICFIVTLAYRFVEMSCSPVDIYFKYLVLHHGYILLTKHINNKNKKHTVASIKKDHKAK